MSIDPLLSSDSDEWGTPRPLFESINRALGLTIDVCARSDQTMLPRFWSKRDQATRRSWAGLRHWMNFPYSKALSFTRHARDEALRPNTLGAWLAPVRPDTEWWRSYVLNLDDKAGALFASRFEPSTCTLWLLHHKQVTAVRWLKGRLKFKIPPGSKAKPGTPAPFPSAVILKASSGTRPLFYDTEWTRGWPS